MEQQKFICQSCAMPMEKPEIFGTNSDGSTTQEYCIYCFKNGKFTALNITMEEMINKCTEIMVQRNIMPEEQAKELMNKTIPNLKRWKK